MDVRPVVTDKQSEIARGILGPERLAAIGGLVVERADPSREPIPVHDALVGLELQTGWITAVFDRLFSATEALAAIDFNDGKCLGAMLPGVWDELIVAATEADDLQRFLERFAPGTGESWVDVASCALSAALGWAMMVIIAVHGDDEAEDDDEETTDVVDADKDADCKERAEARLRRASGPIRWPSFPADTWKRPASTRQYRLRWALMWLAARRRRRAGSCSPWGRDSSG